MTPSTRLAALALCALLGTACAGSGSYELTWTIGCDELAAADCTVTSVRQCSSVGIDAVSVRAIAAGSSDGTPSLFPCFTVDGARGRGPELSAEPTTLEVKGLSPSGQLLSGPVTVSTEIPGSGTVAVRVDLPLPLACSDGVDNDEDGLVDLFDPDCVDEKDPDEGGPGGSQ